MYKLIPFLLLLLLFACSKNPANNADESTATGKMSIYITCDTSGAAKATVASATTTMKIFIQKSDWAAPKVLTPALSSDLSFSVVDYSVPAGVYTVTVTGYDSASNPTWTGARTGFWVGGGTTVDVNIKLKDVRI
jgi:hypothetical protein